MKYRKAVFIVAYTKERPRFFKSYAIKYLLLHRKLHWKGWEFPKGGIERGEKIREAIKREIREEVGLRIKKIKGFNVFGKYKYDKKYEDRKGFWGQSWKLFSAEVSMGKVKIDTREHDKFRWLEFERALALLRWSNQKRCLKIFNKFIKNENPEIFIS